MKRRMCSGSGPGTRSRGRQPARAVLDSDLDNHEKSTGSVVCASFQLGAKRLENTRTLQESCWTESWLVSASAINTERRDEYLRRDTGDSNNTATVHT